MGISNGCCCQCSFIIIYNNIFCQASILLSTPIFYARSKQLGVVFTILCVSDLLKYTLLYSSVLYSTSPYSQVGLHLLQPFARSNMLRRSSPCPDVEPSPINCSCHLRIPALACTLPHLQTQNILGSIKAFRSSNATRLAFALFWTLFSKLLAIVLR